MELSREDWRTWRLGSRTRFLFDTIETMIRRGERRRLLLSNRAIEDYKRFRAERFRVALVS
jgi:hypothetical protein